MTSAVDQNREIQQLKTLLFQTEAARLETLETDVALLQQYVGAADRLEAATADILVAALERAEVNRPRELANAIAPSVVSAIRSEIQNSRDLMVDALYPITGRLVSAAVANAFKELVAFLEQRLNALTSTELWIGRVKSLATGRPISEFVLANSNPPRVNRLLFIERGAGLLISHWKRDEIPNEGADLLSAMVAAILEFSIQALAGEGNLQKLDFGGRELVLRASPRFILAAECVGQLRPADDTRLNSLFFDTIESINNGSNCDAEMLASLAASVESNPLARRKKSRRGKIILFAFVALVAAGLAWLGAIFATRTMLERRTNDALQQLVGEQSSLASFPLRLDFDHGDRTLSVSGIEPSQVDIPPLVDALGKAAAPYRVIDRIGVVPGLEQPAALRAEIAAARQTIARMQASIDEARGAIAEEARSRDRQYAGLNEQYAKLQDETRGAIAEEAKSRNQQYAGLSEQYAGLQSLADGPAERLGRFMATTAVFFATDDKFADNEEAEQQIRELAGLLANNDLRIRIVGHADESGSEAGNKVLARRRAELVLQRLVSLGIEPSRLFAVSRSASVPISDMSGGTSDDNRRVTFETVFRTETRQ
ncbi:OmpA family protein [Rhizobium binxianense]